MWTCQGCNINLSSWLRLWRGTPKPSSAWGGCAAVRQGPPSRKWASPRARPRHCRVPYGPPPRRTRNPHKMALKESFFSPMQRHSIKHVFRNEILCRLVRFWCSAWQKARSGRSCVGSGRGTRSPNHRQGTAAVRRRRSFDMADFRVPPAGQIARRSLTSFCLFWYRFRKPAIFIR